jgi:hypothetical protein
LSVFLKIFTGGGRRITGGGRRITDGGSRAAGHETRPAGVGTRAAGLKTRIPVSGQKTVINQAFTKNRAAPPTRCWTRARAMFFTNNHVKNNMSVSRETLPIFCAVVGGLLTA